MIFIKIITPIIIFFPGKVIGSGDKNQVSGDCLQAHE